MADKLGIKRSLIDYYETRSPNPALDFIERAANALEVSISELLGSEPNTLKTKPGPTSQL
jgi:transcriptional regulator with XRE-family HTH domain